MSLKTFYVYYETFQWTENHDNSLDVFYSQSTQEFPAKMFILIIIRPETTSKQILGEKFLFS